MAIKFLFSINNFYSFQAIPILAKSKLYLIFIIEVFGIVKVKLIFYAVLQEEISDKPLIVEINQGSSASDLINFLAEKYPKVADILKVTRLAHEEEYVERNSLLSEGEEYCLIPPVSGG